MRKYFQSHYQKKDENNPWYKTKCDEANKRAIEAIRKMGIPVKERSRGEKGE